MHYALTRDPGAGTNPYSEGKGTQTQSWSQWDGGLWTEKETSRRRTGSTAMDVNLLSRLSTICAPSGRLGFWDSQIA